MKLPKLNNGDPLIATAGAERSVHVLDVDRCSVVKRWPSAMKFDITRLSLSKSSPDHVYVAGLDNELLCGCWSRGALAGGFAFRGDSRWLGAVCGRWTAEAQQSVQRLGGGQARRMLPRRVCGKQSRSGRGAHAGPGRGVAELLP